MKTFSIKKDDLINEIRNSEECKFSSLLDSIRNFESENSDYCEELLGIDEDESYKLYEKVEKYSDLICKNLLLNHSINVNNKNLKHMEKINFTKDELGIITNRFNEIHSAYDETKSLKENLVSYYMTINETISADDAELIVTRLMSGVEELTTKFQKAMAEGWNPKEHVDAMVEGMTLQQRYDFLVNAISLVNTLNVQTMGEVQDVQATINETIEKMKSGNIEVTDTVCDELQNSLTELLQSSPLMVTNAEQIKEMMDAANGQTTNVVDFASSQYDDYRYKNEMALATWIEYKNDTLTTLPSDMIPEALGVSVAAGVEEAYIMEETSNGKPIEWAVKCLKVLGAIALTCFLGYVAILGLALLAGAFFEASILVMGTSTIAIIAATALSFLICWGYSEVAIKAGTKILEWTGKAYDWIIDKFKEDIVPIIKKGTQKCLNWLKSNFGNNNKINDTFRDVTLDENTNINSTNNEYSMLNLSPTECVSVNSLTHQFITSQNKTKTLKENLIDFYLVKFPGVHPKNAEDIIDSITRGITIFNNTLNEALKQDINNGQIDFTAHLLSVTENMSVKEKYEIYINYLSFLTAIESINLNLDNMTFARSVNEIKENVYIIDKEPTEEMVDEVLNQINELLINSSICITSVKTSRDLLKSLNNEELGTSIIQNEEEDMRNKMIMSVMTYIAIQDGTISLVDTKNITPENVALGVAAGIEEQKVLTCFSKKEYTESKVIKILKIIGGVLLISSLIVATLICVNYGATAIVFGLCELLGDGILATVIASIVTVVATFGILSVGFILGEKVIKVADVVFDTILKYFEDKVLPTTKKLIKQVSDWIKDKLGNIRSNDEDTNNDINNEY